MYTVIIMKSAITEGYRLESHLTNDLKIDGPKNCREH